MDDLERHGEVMGALGRIDQKLDSHGNTLKTHGEDIDDLKNYKAKSKGIALAATIGTATLAAMVAIVAKAREFM